MPKNHFYKYTIVIHNVDPKKENEVKNVAAQKAKEYVCSCEPYPEQSGYHMHLFIEYKNQRSFKSVLHEMQNLSKRVTEPRPPGETRDWGRVQVDRMYGDFKQANSYLLGETKDKPTGEVTHQESQEEIRKRIADEHWKWTLQEIWKRTNIPGYEEQAEKEYKERLKQFAIAVFGEYSPHKPMTIIHPQVKNIFQA
uniref:hypothetical protein n=1 Tax=Mariniflexile sp. TaxID=1979402 RepID=UPI004048C984